MNVFAKFDKIPSMILQDIKEIKRYGHTHGRTDNVKTVYPPTNRGGGGGGGGIIKILFVSPYPTDPEIKVLLKKNYFNFQSKLFF